MKIVLDTCLYIRNDKDQGKLKNFNYDYLEELLVVNKDNIFISPFSLPEIFCKRGYTTINEIQDNLISNNTKTLKYDYEKLKIDFSIYDEVNKYAAIMVYHLTEFLEFFVYEVVVCNAKLDDDNTVDDIKTIIYHETNDFYMGKEINLSNCTKFMKEGAISYIEKVIGQVFDSFGISMNQKDIWKAIANTKISAGVPFQDICLEYLRYARFITSIFKRKYNSEAKKIRLDFGFNDFLIALASKYDCIVLTSDKYMARYLIKYANQNNKDVIKALWNNTIDEVEW